MAKKTLRDNDSRFDYLALEFVRVTELAAIAASHWVGKGDSTGADGAAVDAMRKAFNDIAFSGEIVIGEGAKDEAPELYVGEKVGRGSGGLELDIAVDPLECTSSVAYGRPNAMTVIATGPRGTLYRAADSYMEKIAVGPKARGVISLDAPVRDTIRAVAKALGKPVNELTVAVLDRERHQQLINDIRNVGARVRLFTDGDVAMAIAPCLEESSVDMLLGVGGSTEAVLAAAALRCLGGEILCRWKPKDDTHRARLKGVGITRFDRVLTTSDLAKGDTITFTATGVLPGPLLSGVTADGNHLITRSVMMSSNPKTVRFITTHHKPTL